MIDNKVANSGLITFNLEDHYPEGERVQFDYKPWLFQELILKEKDFREYLKNHDWSQYQNKYVAVTCSADAIIPAWSYMLIFSKLEPFAKKIVFGDLNTLEEKIFDEILSKLDVEAYRDQRIVIKGCSNKPIPVSVYASLTALLQPVVKSIMFGEPCSTVPVYKRKDS
ncbi:MAG: DUF2480 family protein [Bacteroidetes bacterium]|nr:DUF2480 family protein [Bacteroidota bacterium]